MQTEVVFVLHFNYFKYKGYIYYEKEKIVADIITTTSCPS